MRRTWRIHFAGRRPSVESSRHSLSTLGGPLANVAYIGDHQGTPIFQAVFKKHTGMLILAQTRSAVYRGTAEQLEQSYKSAQTHNLLAGWWGVISLLVYNWIAIFSNVSTRNALRDLADNVARDHARSAEGSLPAQPETPGP